MDHKSSLDKYAWRRARAAGGPMVSGGSLDESIAALKEIYLQPLDRLKAEITKRTGHFVSGGVAATANSGLTVTFGGTSASFDHSVNQSIFISKTLSVAGSFTTQWVALYAIN